MPAAWAKLQAWWGYNPSTLPSMAFNTNLCILSFKTRLWTCCFTYIAIWARKPSWKGVAMSIYYKLHKHERKKASKQHLPMYSTCRSQQLPIMWERQGKHRSHVTLKQTCWAAILDAPQSHCSVNATSGKVVAVGMECDTLQGRKRVSRTVSGNIGKHCDTGAVLSPIGKWQDWKISHINIWQMADECSQRKDSVSGPQFSCSVTWTAGKKTVNGTGRKNIKLLQSVQQCFKWIIMHINWKAFGTNSFPTTFWPGKLHRCLGLAFEKKEAFLMMTTKAVVHKYLEATPHTG